MQQSVFFSLGFLLRFNPQFGNGTDCGGFLLPLTHSDDDGDVPYVFESTPGAYLETGCRGKADFGLRYLRLLVLS